MLIHTLTIDGLEGPVKTMAFATEAEVYERLRQEYEEFAEMTDDELVTELTERQSVCLYIDTHEIDHRAQGCVGVWFGPGDIDTHFDGDDDTTGPAAVWRTLTHEQRIDAAKTAQGFFENSDVTWGNFHECIVEGIQTYVEEQLS
jgi:hypothetical protein